MLINSNIWYEHTNHTLMQKRFLNTWRLGNTVYAPGFADRRHQNWRWMSLSVEAWQCWDRARCQYEYTVTTKRVPQIYLANDRDTHGQIQGIKSIGCPQRTLNSQSPCRDLRDGGTHTEMVSHWSPIVIDWFVDWSIWGMSTKGLCGGRTSDGRPWCLIGTFWRTHSLCVPGY